MLVQDEGAFDGLLIYLTPINTFILKPLRTIKNKVK